MSRLRDFVTRAYLSADPRSLGLFRIVFGLVLLLDLTHHWQVIDLWYTDEGLIPGETALANPGSRTISLFFLADSHGEVAFGMALCGAAYLALTLGWKTRVAQILSFVGLISLNGRIALLQMGGDSVMNLLAMWTLFLPLGRRLSLDSLLASLRARHETTPEQIADRDRIAPDTTPVVSLAFLALLLQFACIYALAAVQKNGGTWLSGNAVHYALHQDRLVTQLGVWMREELPPWILAGGSYGSLGLEYLAPFLLLTPLWSAGARLLAAIALPLLHLAFAAGLNIGVFSYAMSSFFLLLLRPQHWDRATAWARQRTRTRTVYFDADCGICLLCVRIIARLDGWRRVRILANTDASLPEGITEETTDVTVVVVDDEGRVFTRSHAVAEVFRSLPFGFAIAWVMRLPGIRNACDLVYEPISANRTTISQRLGLSACGLPMASAPEDEEPPARARATPRVLRVARELAVVVMMVAAWGDIVKSNFALRPVRYRQPAALAALVEYPRLKQDWLMFTPEAPPDDFMISVEAVTADGREVDPYNEVASRQKTPRFDAIPTRLAQDQFFGNYTLFAARIDLYRYYSALERWILRYPERTGNPRDRIERFELVKLADISPAPGADDPTNLRRRVLLRYPPEPPRVAEGAQR